MHLVDTPAFFPGCCILTKTSDGPFIDLLGENAIGERQYVSVALAKEMGRFCGMIGAEQVDDLREQLADAQEAAARADELERELAQLRASVRQTLLRGAVVEKGTEDYKLRPVPGQKAVEVK